MARLNACICLGVAVVLTAPRTLPAQRESLPADSVAIDVDVRPSQSLVSARYWFARPVRALDLVHLTNSCTSIRDLRATRNGLVAGLTSDTTRPWVVWHDTSEVADAEGSLTYAFTYRVDHGPAARLALPMVLPDRPLDARNAPVTPKVRLSVRIEGEPSNAPEFPRFVREPDGRWSAALIAVPATIVVRGALREDQTPCDDAIRMEGSNGGFVTRLSAFIGTLALWIPLYFWWATRQRRGDNEPETA